MLVITHIDLDGFGCELVIKKLKVKFDKLIRVNYIDYEEGTFDYSELAKHKEVLYTDFSPDIKSLEVIRDNNIKCTILDHHESAFNEIDPWLDQNNYREKIDYVYSKTKSGTLLTYNHFQRFDTDKDQSFIDLVYLIDTYDLWKKDSENWGQALNLNRLFWNMLDWRNPANKYEKPLDHFMNRLFKLKKEPWSFNMFEKRIIETVKGKEVTAFQQALKTVKKRKDPYGNTYCVVKASSKVSMVGYIFHQKYRKLDYLVIINTYQKPYKFSLRAKDHINLLEIVDKAKGHAQACGVDDNDPDFITGFYQNDPTAIKRFFG